MNTTGTPTVVSGGTGYTNGDTLTIAGTSATLTVTGVSGGVITSVASGNFIPVSLASIPANPASVTGGTGSGATFTILWKPLALTITNAGSGYVEQPTVSFSGGGGSGAAAYAKVGSATTIRPSLNGVTNFVGIGGGTALQIYDAGGSSGSSGSYWNIGTNFSSSGAVLFSTHEANFSSASTNALRFYTNTVAQEQLRVAHTASAVNYVQVTGAATGVTPTISGQGSDSNVGVTLASKGVASVILMTNSQRQFDVYGPTSAVNYIRAAGATAGNAVSFTASGTDTNIDLTLTPKGTGNVRFGTFTANMALVVQGYIEIKDSGGTVRKLAVIA
jgi:hypothetical protein